MALKEWCGMEFDQSIPKDSKAMYDFAFEEL